MKILLLLFACLWPFCHKPEVRSITLDPNGNGVIALKKHHDLKACTFTGTTATGTEVRPDGKQLLHVHGKRGEVATASCP